MSLATGKRIHSYIWKTLQVGEDVIDRVNQIAEDEGQPLIAENFTFEWRLGDEMSHEDENEDINEETSELIQPNRIDTPMLQTAPNDDESECSSDNSESCAEDASSSSGTTQEEAHEEDDKNDQVTVSENDSDDTTISEYVHDDTDDIKDDNIHEEQGADNIDIIDDPEEMEGSDVVTTENVTEDDDETNGESELEQPTFRSGTRTGLRKITKPPGSHRNRYEREFSYATINRKVNKANSYKKKIIDG